VSKFLDISAKWFFLCTYCVCGI